MYRFSKYFSQSYIKIFGFKRQSAKELKVSLTIIGVQVFNLNQVLVKIWIKLQLQSYLDPSFQFYIQSLVCH